MTFISKCYLICYVNMLVTSNLLEHRLSKMSEELLNLQTPASEKNVELQKL